MRKSLLLNCLLDGEVYGFAWLAWMPDRLPDSKNLRRSLCRSGLIMPNPTVLRSAQQETKVILVAALEVLAVSYGCSR